MFSLLLLLSLLLLQKLNALEGLPQDAILCTVDVVGLYPSIPHDEGLESIREALKGQFPVSGRNFRQ